ncbi:unnamed protein product [Caenorhabditis bovis]|uniref:Major sperm protein n=1 Tax=Caenorhabditis bovis TaxID=2654633 RepID=A0A8S1EGX9_9PELO|nr:unnamed protein product [Caenorhabditis bovis]
MTTAPPVYRRQRRCSSTFTDPSNVLAIQELRSRLLQDTNLTNRQSEEDIHRIRNEDWWLNQFLYTVDYDVDIAYAIVLECLKWRKSFDVERISLLQLKPLLDNQLMYLHGKDLQNRYMLWINMKHYRNGDDNFERLFCFWLERHYMENRGTQPMTLFIDMSGTGLKNMSFDAMKFIIHSNRYYYPNAIESILVFDNPSILNASWKVIGSWLDSSSNIRNDLLTFVTKASVSHYVPKTYLQQHHGGTDSFKFTMDELAKCLPPPPPPKPSQKLVQAKMQSIDDTTNNNNIATDFDFSAFQKRNVKFDEESTTRRAMSISRRSSKGPKNRKPHIPPSLRPLIDKRVNAPTEEWASNDFVSATPRDEIRLNKYEGENDFVDVILVKNLSPETPLMFKFKTTSPEKFRVRPSSGIIPAGGTEIIRVYLQYEYRHSWNKEKFLLLAMESTSADVENFTELFKNADKKAEYKFKCKMAENVTLDTPEERRTSFNLQNQQIPSKTELNVKLEMYLPLIVLVLILFVIFQFIYILQMRSDNDVLRDTILTLSNQMKLEATNGQNIVKENMNTAAEL